MSKETLRQCDVCKKDCSGKVLRMALNPEYGNVECVYCTIDMINKHKKEAGDTTEFVLIEKPWKQRLGQAVQNAYRKQWEGLNYDILVKNWDSMSFEDRFLYRNGLHEYAKAFTKNKYWDIWEQDTPDIQEKINLLNK